jgi:hypothetical protein
MCEGSGRAGTRDTKTATAPYQSPDARSTTVLHASSPNGSEQTDDRRILRTESQDGELAFTDWCFPRRLSCPLGIRRGDHPSDRKEIGSLRPNTRGDHDDKTNPTEAKQFSFCAFEIEELRLCIRWRCLFRHSAFDCINRLLRISADGLRGIVG